MLKKREKELDFYRSYNNNEELKIDLLNITKKILNLGA